MKKELQKHRTPINALSSYTDDFFRVLFDKLELSEPSEQSSLKHGILSAAETYKRFVGYHEIQLPPHQIKKELNKALANIDKASESLNTVFGSENYNREFVDGLYSVISEKHPSLQKLLKEIRPHDTQWFPIEYPEKSLILLSALREGIERTLTHYPVRKTTRKSKPLIRWLCHLAHVLEPVIGRTLEQSRYHKTEQGGFYVSKRKSSDSELLLYIITALDPDVTIAQIETAIKETHQERNQDFLRKASSNT